MAKPLSNRIAEVRRSKKMSQQQLADAIGAHWTTVSKLERGITKLNFDYAEEIAEALQVDTYDLLPPRSTVVDVAVSGFVHLGGDIEEIAEEDEHSLMISSQIFYDPDTFWIRVKENALYPYFKDKDVLGLKWVDDDDRRDADGNIDYSVFSGRFCLVEDDSDKKFMGVLSANPGSQLVDLLNANFPPLKGIKPKALAQVTVAFMNIPTWNKKPAEDDS